MPVFTKKRVFVAIALLVVGGAVAMYYQKEKGNPKEEEPKYKTAVVDKGNISQTVTASGTLNPVALISVGSQVSGTVVELKADFNDRVKQGQILLKLDPTIFNAQIKQSEASLASAEASKRLAQATLERNQKLVTQNYISGTAMDQARREVEVADANIKLARAQLDRVKADLNNSVIRSPIDGVIIKRTIDMGQTVAASFQTPNLFQIARDLTKMQIDTSVSEADVGSLKDGLPARFVVDAYPDREFEAKLRQFRLAANVQQNVVTYNVVLDVDNKNELLKPGMTAQVRLVVGSRENVIRIPTAALRYKPSEEEQAKEAKALKDKEKNGSAAATASASAGSNLPAPDVDDDVAFRTRKDLTRTFKLYKLDDKNQARTVDVKIGLSNFKYTEVISGDLKPGDKVITRALDKAGAR
ncbi:efflux RND transporter periplasmic adaptor subunit [Undibacterium sp. Di26W]|uniref:efflux RND transporter periplasmic adaptor subunit n=1 Tax=Undibacterium sp. Di26W TaxID=3413035 RepID=UPI003BF25A4A